jgi:inner membrane protein involved in colicin E2 resistance
MQLVTEPDIYSPSLDELGNYIDKIPSYSLLKHGLRCPCGSRKDKIYQTQSIFSSHVKTKTHQQWLATLNLNKSNYFVENEKLKTTIQNQKLIIAKLERELNNKIMTIDYLTQQLGNMNINNSEVVNNLLDFD